MCNMTVLQDNNINLSEEEESDYESETESETDSEKGPADVEWDIVYKDIYEKIFFTLTDELPHNNPYGNILPVRGPLPNDIFMVEPAKIWEKICCRYKIYDRVYLYSWTFKCGLSDGDTTRLYDLKESTTYKFEITRRFDINSNFVPIEFWKFITGITDHSSSVFVRPHEKIIQDKYSDIMDNYGKIVSMDYNIKYGKDELEQQKIYDFDEILDSEIPSELYQKLKSCCTTTCYKLFNDLKNSITEDYLNTPFSEDQSNELLETVKKSIEISKKYNDEEIEELNNYIHNIIKECDPNSDLNKNLSNIPYILSLDNNINHIKVFINNGKNIIKMRKVYNSLKIIKNNFSTDISEKFSDDLLELLEKAFNKLLQKWKETKTKIFDYISNIIKEKYNDSIEHVLDSIGYFNYDDTRDTEIYFK